MNLTDTQLAILKLVPREPKLLSAITNPYDVLDDLESVEVLERGGYVEPAFIDGCLCYRRTPKGDEVVGE